MTALQAFGVGFIAVIFFGSIGLGLYLKKRDYQEVPPPVKPPKKTESMNDVRRKLEMVPTQKETIALLDVLDRYYAEVERLAEGYYEKAVIEGEAAAMAWLRGELRKTN